MILYHGGGSGSLELLKQVPGEAWSRTRFFAGRLLHARSQKHAAELLNELPFELYIATNDFGDDFHALVIDADTEEYSRLTSLISSDIGVAAEFQKIASICNELGPFYVRFITLRPSLGVSIESVKAPSPALATETVDRCLSDAEHLLLTKGAVSAVDRTHTAFHGYLQAICAAANLPFETGDSVTRLFKLIRTSHPAFTSLRARSAEVDRVCNALATVVDSLGPARNYGSLAHPTEDLLNEPEALLVVNSIRTLFHYIECRVQQPALG